MHIRLHHLLFIILTGLLASCLFLGGTPQGMRASIKLLNHISTITIQAEQIEGSLFSGKITLSKLKVLAHQQRLTADSLQAHFDAWALFKGQLHFDQYLISHARWMRPIGKEDNANGPSMRLGDASGEAIWQPGKQHITLHWRSPERRYTADLVTDGQPKQFSIHGQLNHARHALLQLQGERKGRRIHLYSVENASHHHAFMLNVGWSGRSAVDVQLNLKNLHLEQLFGTVNGTINAAILGHFQRGQYTLNLNTLSGKLNGGPISMAGQLIGDPSGLKLIKLRGHAASATIQLNLSQSHQTWLGEAALNFPRLEQLNPNLSGAFTVQLKATPGTAASHVKLDISAAQLAWSLNEIARLQAHVDLQSDLNKPIAMQLDTTGIQLTSAPQLSELHLNTHGTRRQHVIQLRAKLDEYVASGRMNAGFSDHAWQGTLTKLHYAHPQMPWSLAEPTHLTLGRQQVALSALCLAHQDQRACLQGQAEKSGPWSLALHFDHADLLALGPALPDVHGLDMRSGTLKGTLTLRGSHTLESVDGALHLSKLKMSFPQLESMLEDGDVTLNATGHQINLHAQGRFDQQWLKFGSTTHILALGARTRAWLNGQNLPISRAKRLSFTISPTLSFSLIDGHARLSGDITVPSAHILSLASANIETLPDDVTVQSEDPIEENSHAHLLRILGIQSAEYTLNIRLLPKVFADIKGLAGNYVGQIRLTGTQDAHLGSGVLNIEHGHYYAFGQKLNIQDAAIDFSGGSLNNPHINMQAFREFGDFKAAHFATNDTKTLRVGISVTGRLQNYKVNLVSQPTGLSSKDILALILFGERSESLASNNSYLLLSALTSINFNNGEHALNVISQLQNSLGLDEISIETQTPQDTFSQPHDFGALSMQDLPASLAPSFSPGDSGKTSANTPTNPRLILGKQLGKNLYVRYNMGMDTGQQNVAPYSISLYYTINQYLQLQAITSQTRNAFNLMYIIERD